ncbi:conserved hypothetical protein [Uncinocarpus reesii 1704]|uniref:High-temperature-induced dauer-formation protein n=1 Tax=Uncinocarpus reesii (strain UAMH 1704) TaxID=336963 RepID=C4JLY0_UNCRE|nr:uncharacterized protein UREG_03838 [Uncinocarpus reesii 1704]EEP78992.1 conserved hypothetical protein [Uncinocarpus reesii 1704]
MGASESKLVFRQGIFRLSEEKNIPADDPYWTGFWELPESVEDVFTLFAPVDIRRTRDTALGNLETLLLAVTSRLTALRHHPSFPDPQLAPPREALNCIRVLTRLLPFLYEAEHLEIWEEKFFWGQRKRKTRQAQLASRVLFDESRNEEDRDAQPQEEDYEDAKPLAEELLDTLVDLLFFAGFTIPQLPSTKGKVQYSIWQSGIGCHTSMGSNKELESNRMEILRLLLTLTGQSMYMPPNLLPVKGVKSLTYLTTCPDKKLVLSVLCSLLNTTLKYNPAPWKMPYDHVVWKDSRQILVIYSLQLLLTLLLYPIPEGGNGAPPKNYYRHFFGRLHQPQDFQFLVDGMTRILNQPVRFPALAPTSSYLPGSQKSVKWAPEMMMLFWEALQCNKRFRSFIVDSSRAYDFIIICLFYANEYKTDPTKHGIVKMCVFLLQTLSVEPGFGCNLFKKFDAQDTLPPSIRLPNFRGTYGDFLIISIHTLMSTSKGKLDAVYPALLAIMNNIAAYTEHLSPAACSRVIQLFASMASPSFLLAQETNHVLLSSLLKFINTVLEHQYSNIRTPVQSLSHVPEEDSAFAIGDDDSDEETQRQPTPSQSSPSLGNSGTPSLASPTDESVPHQLRGLSEKARGKMPAGQAAFSRQNSNTSLNSYAAASSLSTTASGFVPTAAWIESWVPELPLHTILTVISAISPHVQAAALESSLNPEARTLLSELPSFKEEPHIQAVLSDPSPIQVHLFEWSPLSLGWYESLLWGFIFSSEMVVGSASGSTPGAVGVWNGTALKLFRVQEAAAQGPTLLAPKGAVDAVGSSIVQRIGSLNLRGRSSVSQDGQGESESLRVREV